VNMEFFKASWWSAVVEAFLDGVVVVVVVFVSSLSFSLPLSGVMVQSQTPRLRFGSSKSKFRPFHSFHKEHRNSGAWKLKQLLPSWKAILVLSKILHGNPSR
jgi:hypothetical protein